MKGIAQTTTIDKQSMALQPEKKTFPSNNQSLRESVRQSLQDYFIQLEGQTPSDLYNLVLAQVEKPMLEMVLQHTGNNQSKAAKILGLSRGTLRKKMAIYGLFNK